MSELISQYWYVLVGGIGILLILGAVFKWKWAMQREGDRPLGFMSWIYTLFGETGYRIAIGVAGVLLVVFTVVYAVLLVLWGLQPRSYYYPDL
jgi:ABC-type multidrug transport system permease subunit